MPQLQHRKTRLKRVDYFKGIEKTHMKKLLKILLASLLLMSCSTNTNLPSDSISAADPAESMADFCKEYPRPNYKNLKRIPYTSDWFELYQVADGVTAIYEPHQWQEVISYLIEGKTEALLFDTGNGIADMKKVVDYLTDKPLKVLNSHTHYDHVGGNYAFENVYGMNTAFTVDRQQGHANKDIAIEVSQEALCRPLPQGVSEKNHIGKPFIVKNFIEHGYVFDLGERSLEVIHIPGHTPDSIALVDREAGLMWTGDTYYAGPIWLYAPETNLSQYTESLQTLIKEKPNFKALLPAHNTPWESPGVLIRVQDGFNKVLEGKATKEPQGDYMMEYTIQNESNFSFLMSDEALPY